MNEQINGLWWKASIGYNNQSCDPEVIEKFAELIVEECAELVETQHTWITSVSASALIRKHFGVES